MVRNDRANFIKRKRGGGKKKKAVNRVTFAVTWEMRGKRENLLEKLQ